MCWELPGCQLEGPTEMSLGSLRSDVPTHFGPVHPHKHTLAGAYPRRKVLRPGGARRADSQPRRSSGVGGSPSPHPVPSGRATPRPAEVTDNGQDRAGFWPPAGSPADRQQGIEVLWGDASPAPTPPRPGIPTPEYPAAGRGSRSAPPLPGLGPGPPGFLYLELLPWGPQPCQDPFLCSPARVALALWAQRGALG